MSDIYCEICYETKPIQSYCTLSCSHQFCKECLMQFFHSISESKEFYKAICPSDSCSNRDLDDLAKQVLSETEFEIYNKDKYFYILTINPLTRWCPSPDCKGFTLYEDEKVLNCNTCDTQYCADCVQTYEPGHKCIKSTDFYEYMKKIGARACPGCKNLVEKFSGCSNMTCRCGTSFCMACGEILNDKHDWLSCLIGYTNPSYFAIIFLILSFITFPFQFAFYLWRINAYEQRTEQGAVRDIWLTNFMYFFTFLVSPFITIILLFMVTGYVLVNPGGKNLNFYLPKSIFFWVLKPIVYFVVYIVLAALLIIVYMVLNVYLTGRGLIALGKKIIKL